MAIAKVLQGTSEFYDVPLDLLSQPSRQRSVVKTRRIACYLARDLFGAPLMSIGAAINRGHTTVLRGIELIEQQAATDPELANSIATLKQKLRNAR